jgi:hypothetical protein
LGDEIEDEICRAYGMYEEEEKWIQGFGLEL